MGHLDGNIWQAAGCKGQKLKTDVRVRIANMGDIRNKKVMDTDDISREQRAEREEG